MEDVNLDGFESGRYLKECPQSFLAESDPLSKSQTESAAPRPSESHIGLARLQEGIHS